MNKAIIASAVALLLTCNFASAQSSQSKGGPAITGETANPSKGMAQTGSKMMKKSKKTKKM